MILVYADGGGLGHLTRVRALVHTLGIDEPVVVLTSSPAAGDARVVDALEVRTIPFRRDDRSARRAWLARTVADLAPSRLVVDAFPAGLAGEVDAATVGRVPCDHVARLLRWDTYRAVLPAVPAGFATTYVVEEVGAAHHAHLRDHSDRIVPLELVDPEPATAEPTSLPGSAPRWLVVHSGPAAEVDELVAYARGQATIEGATPLFVVACRPDAAPTPAGDLVVLDRYPIWPLHADADRVVTAAGFNAMRQLAPQRDRHRFLPLPRRFDDQFERARRARAQVLAS